MGMKPINSNCSLSARILAMVLSSSFIVTPALGDAQATTFADLIKNVLNPGAAQAATEGARSIAQGNQNTKEGESTQNMQQMAMGAMQIAQGLLGLLAAAAAQDKSGTSAGRESGLSSTGGYNPGGYGTSPTPGSTNPKGGTTGEPTTTNLGEGKTTGTSSIDFNSKPINTALSSIEKNYGIPRDKFVEALKNGVAPKDIFANAPKNAISPDLGARIAEGLAASNAAASADAVKSISNGALASAGGAGTGSPTGASETPAVGPRMPASTAPPSEFDELEAAKNMNLSPEIKAAMAAKAEQMRREKEMKEMHGWSIFQLVANRYRKLEPMLYGRVERTNPNPIPPQVRN